MTEKINTKFDKLSTRIEIADRRAEASESLAKENKNNISNLPSESTAHQERLSEQGNKTHELEKGIKYQVNRSPRITLVIRGM